MHRISALTEKLTELAMLGDKATIIDIDLMLDYTRVIYADLLEQRGKALFNTSIQGSASRTNLQEQKLPTVEPTSVETETPTQPQFLPTSPTQETEIRKAIGINDKYLFISELFGNDRSSYEDAINTLNSMHSAQEAQTWISNNLHRQNNWDKENDVVISFYDVVNNFFASR